MFTNTSLYVHILVVELLFAECANSLFYFFATRKNSRGSRSKREVFKSYLSASPFSLSLSLFLLSFAAAAQHVKRKKERIKLLLKRLHEYFDQRQKLASLAFSASRTTTRHCHIFFFVTLQSPELHLMGRQ